uniref:Hedgehog/intein domain-like protein n=1 Tax=Adineta vaga TaxID=104782 RepID=B3G4R6_ADIVA|nr:hedgehog/intein domain-like protein [Adineta vaga]
MDVSIFFECRTVTVSKKVNLYPIKERLLRKINWLNFCLISLIYSFNIIIKTCSSTPSQPSPPPYASIDFTRPEHKRNRIDIEPPRRPTQPSRDEDNHCLACWSKTNNRIIIFISTCIGIIICITLTVTLSVVLTRKNKDESTITATTATTTTTTTTIATTTTAPKSKQVFQGLRNVFLEFLTELGDIFSRYFVPNVCERKVYVYVCRYKYFPKCFDGNSFAIRADGSWIRMRDLKIGDPVLVTQELSCGRIIVRTSPILAVDVFQMHNPDFPVDYLEIFVKSNLTMEPLRITPYHSLLVKKQHYNRPRYIFASQVNVGDTLFFVVKNGFFYSEIKINAIKKIKLFDAYAPLTFEGSLIVNGTLLHLLVHQLMAPRRWLLYYSLQIAFTAIEHDYLKEEYDTIENFIFYIDFFKMSVREKFQVFTDLLTNIYL